MYTESPLIKDWIKHQLNILKRIYPTIPEKEIKEFLKEEVNDKLINREVLIHNNYFHQVKRMTLLEVTEWIRDKQPLMAGFGVFFKNQHQSINPNAHMLRQFITLRKKYKNKLHELQPESYEYKTADRQQLTEKVNANSFYGCNGAKVSRFFNLYTAASVTLTGQSLNSTTGQAFEAFLRNSVKFYNLDECFEYLENIRKESYKKADFSYIPPITVTQVLERLKGMFYQYKEDYEYPIFRYLMNLPMKKLQAIYFKNNLYEFSKLPRIEESTINILRKIDVIKKDYKVPKDADELLLEKIRKFEKTGEVDKEIEDIVKVLFKNPNDVPKEIKDDLEELWAEYRQWVFYNYTPFDRINRMKYGPRQVVPMADTDSNFVHLDPWVEYVNTLIENDEELANKDRTQLWFATINIMCFYLTKMVNEVLWKYTTTANVPEDYRSGINMKNEYLYSKLYTTTKKKRYIGSIRLREGTELLPEKLDIKGHDFIKSTTREETKEYFKMIIKKRLLEHPTADVYGLFEDLRVFEKYIEDSLKNGEKKFLSPMKVKDFEVYAYPLREQSVRSAIAWNAAYPSMQITPPEVLDVVKVKMQRLEDIKDLKEIEPEIYENLRKTIYEGDNPEISKKGINVFGLPQYIEEIPEWLRPYIDIRTIKNDNISRFHPVLESLGITTINMDNKSFWVNVKQIG